MPRQKKIDRPREMKLYLPDSVRTMVDQELFSEIEQRVPFGAMNNLGVQLFTDWLRNRGRIV